MKTPMSSDTKLTKDEECESVDSTMYRGMIGSLLYLTARRPDIMFSVCLCARFQEDLKTSHLEAPLTTQQERKTRKDYGTGRGRSSTFSSSAFSQPSSSYLNDDGNDEGTSRTSTPSSTHFVNSLTNEVP
ncbi:hypothetical protein Tco_0705820 [Tanacetum coccineum]|uniref:Uncharacterized protein n=1 Tax=Tanacetum coccineum TaxID=301880 RepID=A0ABQ4Y5R7_9ASTR